MIGRLSDFSDFLHSLSGKTAVIVYPYVDDAESRNWYNPQPASVISDNIRALEILQIRPLLIDIDRFRRTRTARELHDPEFVIDLDGGVGPIAMKALVPAVAAWLGVPVVPTRVDVWLTGERKDVGNMMAKQIGARLPATFDNRTFDDRLDAAVIVKPRDLGGSYGVYRSDRDQAIQKVVSSRLDMPLLAQNFIPGYDVTFPLCFSPASDQLEVLGGVVNRPENPDNGEWINDLEGKTRFFKNPSAAHIVREVIQPTTSVCEFLLKLTDAMEITTYCRVDFRVPLNHSSPDTLELEDLYFLEGTSKNDAVGVKLDVSRGLPDRGQA